MPENHKFKYNREKGIIELKNPEFYKKYSSVSILAISKLLFDSFTNKDILKLIIAINKHKATKEAIMLSLGGIILIENNQIYYKSEDNIQTDFNIEYDKDLGGKIYTEYDLEEVMKTNYMISCNCDEFISVICKITNELGLYFASVPGQLSNEAILESFELLSLIENNIDLIL
ncbi:hypothetical protein [Clostridium mediterraneense]|uniref:hypothetical protein n=1 Tax=Clostridium mediterraneense TaxID=1805472 RepID=UPI00082DCAF1|nr:hypothetical protein [Clostridium mediterraneense]